MPARCLSECASRKGTNSRYLRSCCGAACQLVEELQIALDEQLAVGPFADL